MEPQLTLAALDPEGNVVEEYITTTNHCISELDIRLDVLKRALYNGEIDHILIGSKKINGRD
jgi:hypothetical protein